MSEQKQSSSRIIESARNISVNIPWECDSSQRTAKRVFDLLVSSILLLMTFPLILVVACLVKLTSPGPVFFVQERLGLHGWPFRMYKFRTMTDGKADGSAHELMEVTKTDPRLTSIGAFLRASRLDELPQLLHVVIGEMSLVGPRPDVPQNEERYTEEQLLRFRMPQGCTTWGVVRGGLANDWSTRQDINAEYVRDWSFLLDLKIIVQTFFVLVLQKGTNPDSAEN